MNSHSIRLGIVDDHPPIIEGLCFAAIRDEKLAKSRNSSPIRVSRVASTVDVLLADSRFIFDVVALDLSLSDSSSPRTNVEKLVTAGCKVLIFTGIDDTKKTQQALAAGALGVSLKSQDLAYTLNLILRVAAGETIDNQELARAISSDQKFLNARLSSQQKEVLRLYASGFTREMVSAKGNGGTEAVKKSISRIRKKYASVGRPARTRIDLYHRAVEDGLIE